VYAADLLVELFTEIKDGKRINVEVKAKANRLAARLVSELSSLPPKDAA